MPIACDGDHPAPRGTNDAETNDADGTGGGAHPAPRGTNDGMGDGAHPAPGGTNDAETNDADGTGDGAHLAVPLFPHFTHSCNYSHSTQAS